MLLLLAFLLDFCQAQLQKICQLHLRRGHAFAWAWSAHYFSLLPLHPRPALPCTALPCSARQMSDNCLCVSVCHMWLPQRCCMHSWIWIKKNIFEKLKRSMALGAFRAIGGGQQMAHSQLSDQSRIMIDIELALCFLHFPRLVPLKVQTHSTNPLTLLVSSRLLQLLTNRGSSSNNFSCEIHNKW